MTGRWLRMGVVSFLSLWLLGGCSTLGYYYQAARGQLALTFSARSIERWISDTATPPELRERLEVAQSIRIFASGVLGLPDNGSYRDYADLHRPYVVWNVVAAPEFSTQPYQWCFPVAGCVAYQGWFTESGATRVRDRMIERGYDAFVYGVPAYSTLGWFDDPVLSTFVRYPRPELARLIFHELAHQVVYVEGDSTFNESFATAVELEGVRRWLAGHGTDEERRTFEAMGRYRADFVALIARTRTELDAVYAGPGSAEDKRRSKQKAFAALRERYGQLKDAWGGFAGYDRWFSGPVGNAQIASVATYTGQVPAFQALLAREGGDLARFYAAVKRLGSLDPEARARALTGIVVGDDNPGAAP